MRITIDLNEHDRSATVAPTADAVQAPAAVDAGGPPAELLALQAALSETGDAANVIDLPAAATATEAGSPPDWLVDAIGGSAIRDVETTAFADDAVDAGAGPAA